MPKATKTKSLTRREFGRRAALGAATAALLPAEILISSRTAVITPRVLAQQQDTKLSPDSQAEVDAKIEAILRKYGSRFNDAQKADIRRLVSEGQKPLETMRASALDNADQPANVMRIYPDSAAPTRTASTTSATSTRETRKG